MTPDGKYLHVTNFSQPSVSAFAVRGRPGRTSGHDGLLERFGPQLGRPRADTLNGSRHANLKELRFSAADGVWRFAYAFDPARRAIILCGGDKSGGSEKRFYRQLVEKADRRFAEHVARIKQQKKKGK
jgi:hypothetical protein